MMLNYLAFLTLETALLVSVLVFMLTGSTFFILAIWRLARFWS